MTALPDALVNQALLETVCWRAWPEQGNQRLADALQALSAYASDTASTQAIAAARDALQDPNPEQASAAIARHLSAPQGAPEAAAPASTDWVAEALEWLDQAQAALLQLETQPQDPHAMQRLKRALHTVKGGAGLSARHALGQHMHGLEQQLAESTPALATDALLQGLDQARALLTGAQEATAQAMSWRLDPAQMDDLQARCDDLLQLQHQLQQSPAAQAPAVLAQMVRHSKRLAQYMQTLRLQPLQPLLDAMQRVVRDAAKAQQKDVALHISGGHTTLDAGMVQALREPLTHLLRNAVAHGIEPAQLRQQRQKPSQGHIHLTVSLTGGLVQLTIEDDGAGIDEAALRTRAAQAEDVPLIALLARPGLSAASHTDTVAGRGMGVHAAQQAVQALAGTLSVTHEPQQGCCWRMTLPQSLALQEVVHVSVGAHAMLIPAVHVLRVVDPTHTLDDPQAPRTALHAYACFAPHPAPANRPTPWQVWLQSGAGHYRLLVDQVHGVHEVLVRPADPLLANVAHLAGHARLPDNRVACVIHPDPLYYALQRALGKDTTPCAP